MVQPHPRLTSFFGMRKHRSLIVGIKEENLGVLNPLKFLARPLFCTTALYPSFKMISTFHSQVFLGSHNTSGLAVLLVACLPISGLALPLSGLLNQLSPCVPYFHF